ncbi:MAG: hypothetical protein S4CHLAM45_02900 [Chlamydiales bacterium]|nr:hypothetical protein [Chlamydiales bacterium]MCH9619148.1 hypothetical protein [Chlamydiales bacterium]MCH9622410.1 hypothetical protein [Chlamydiales bacterium]
MSVRPPRREERANPQEPRREGEDSRLNTLAAASMFRAIAGSDDEPAASSGGESVSPLGMPKTVSPELLSRANSYLDTTPPRSSSRMSTGKSAFTPWEQKFPLEAVAEKNPLTPPQFHSLSLKGDSKSPTRDRDVVFTTTDGINNETNPRPFRNDLKQLSGTVYGMTSQSENEPFFSTLLEKLLNPSSTDEEKSIGITQALDAMEEATEGDLSFSALIEFRREDGRSEMYAVSRGSDIKVLYDDGFNVHPLNLTEDVCYVDVTPNHSFLLITSSLAKHLSLPEIEMQMHPNYSAEQAASYLLKTACENKMSDGSLIAIRPFKAQRLEAHHSKIKGAAKKIFSTLLRHTKQLNVFAKTHSLRLAAFQRSNLGISENKRSFIREQIKYVDELATQLESDKEELPLFLAYFHEDDAATFGQHSLKKLKSSMEADQKQIFEQALSEGETISSAYFASLEQSEANTALKEKCALSVEAERRFGPLDKQVKEILTTEREGVERSDLSPEAKKLRLEFLDQIEQGKEVDQTYLTTFESAIVPRFF